MAQLTILGSAPRSAHAEASGARRLRSARSGGDCGDILERFVGDAGVIARRLRAIGAIFRAAAGLDRQQRRQLHAVTRVMGAMDGLRLVQQIAEGDRHQRLDIVDAEALLRRAARATSDCGFVPRCVRVETHTFG